MTGRRGASCPAVTSAHYRFDSSFPLLQASRAAGAPQRREACVARGERKAPVTGETVVMIYYYYL